MSFPALREPSSVTAKFAGVLAVIGGLRAVLGSVAIPFLETDPDFDPTGFWRKMQILMMVAGVLGALLLAGGVLLLRRKRIGQMLLGVGGGGTLALSLIVSIAIYNHVNPGGAAEVTVLKGPTTIGAIGVAFNVATLVLTFVPSTSRWLAYDEGVTARR